MLIIDNILHKYFWVADGKKREYISVTTLLKRFDNGFDAVAISEGVAAKRGGTPEYWQEQWKQENKASIERGNTLHAEKEEVALSRGVHMFEGQAVTVHNHELYDINHYSRMPDGLYIELPIFHHGYRVCGRADQTFIFTETDGRYAHIKDHKTNKKIEKTSFQYTRGHKAGQYKMMRPPVGHLMDCNFWHYSLQQSMYMFFLEVMGFKPGTIQLIHYPHKRDCEILDPPPVYYDVPYLRKEVIAILEHYRKNP